MRIYCISVLFRFNVNQVLEPQFQLNSVKFVRRSIDYKQTCDIHTWNEVEWGKDREGALFPWCILSRGFRVADISCAIRSWLLGGIRLRISPPVFVYTLRSPGTPAATTAVMAGVTCIRRSWNSISVPRETCIFGLLSPSATRFPPSNQQRRRHDRTAVRHVGTSSTRTRATWDICRSPDAPIALS